MHEAKIDVVTMPNLSEHLATAATTAQLSARFAYAAAMKSINNLLLLGDGESWARQRVDFAGLKLWPDAVLARLAQSQLVEDGTYPGAAAVFAEAGPGGSVTDFDPNQPRDPDGRWASGGELSSNLINPAAFHVEREHRRERKQRKRLERERTRREGEQSGKPPAAPHEQRLEHPVQAPEPAREPPSARTPATAPETTPFQSQPSQPFPPPPTVFKPDGIPDHWIEKPTRKKGGMQWSDPSNQNNSVRSMPADPDSIYPHQQVPYIVDQNGAFRDVDGKRISGSDPGTLPSAHIPTNKFLFRRF